MKPDRRSGYDRRNALRYRLIVDLQYEDYRGRRTGTLSDISPDGCFILGGGETRDGDVVKVFLPLSTGMTVQFAGVIANHILEIGFAVRFGELSAAQTEFLENFIEVHKETGKIAGPL